MVLLSVALGVLFLLALLYVGGLLLFGNAVDWMNARERRP
jgi:hypothetical protein